MLLKTKVTTYQYRLYRQRWDMEALLHSQQLETRNHLALEINIYSPSDCDHWFKFQLSSDAMENDKDAVAPHHDPTHGWIHGQQVKAPPRSAILRVFRPTRLVFKNELPRVNAVTCLVMRRQLRRCLSPMGLAMLLSSLNRLEHISYEPWAPYDARDREFHDRGMHSTHSSGSDHLPLIPRHSPLFCDAKSSSRDP